jgi:hypothetical protein
MFGGVFVGGIFFAIGEDGEDDLAGFLRVWKGTEPAVDVFDGAADGVKECGAGARGV